MFNAVMSKTSSSGKAEGKPLQFNFLKFIAKRPPPTTPSDKPEVLTGRPIFTSLVATNSRKSTCTILSVTGWNWIS